MLTIRKLFTLVSLSLLFLPLFEVQTLEPVPSYQEALDQFNCQPKKNKKGS